MNELTAAAIFADKEELRREDQEKRNANRHMAWSESWFKATGEYPASKHVADGAKRIQDAIHNAAWANGDLDAICRPSAQILVHPAWFERRPRHGNQGRLSFRHLRITGGDAA